MTTMTEVLEALHLEHGSYEPKGKRPRPTVSFLVPLTRVSGQQERGWMALDGSFTSSLEQAARFRLLTSRTQAERIRSERLCHDIVGGLDEWHDLESSISSFAVLLRTQVEAVVWPDGRPETTTEEEAAEQELAFNEAWLRHDSPERRLWGDLLEQRNDVRFMGDWPQLAVEPPKGWETLHELPDSQCPPWLLREIREAYLLATTRLEEGNAQSSER